MKKIKWIVLVTIVTAGAWLLNSQEGTAVKSSGDVITQIDSKIYRPHHEGVNALTVDVEIPHVSKIVSKMMAKQKKKKTSYRIKSTLHWENGKTNVNVFGLPKNADPLRDALVNSVSLRADTLFSKPLKETFKHFNVVVSGKSELTAKPKRGLAYKNDVEKYVVHYDSEYRVTKFESHTLDGRIVTRFNYRELPNGKLVTDRAVVHILGKGYPLKITNDFEYQKVNTGHYFPNKVTTKRSANGKLIEKATAEFSNFRVEI